MSNWISDTKTAWASATGTTSTGIATLFDWIPNDIGKLGTLVGIVLSVVLICVHVRKLVVEGRRADLENRKLEEEIKRLEENR